MSIRKLIVVAALLLVTLPAVGWGQTLTYGPPCPLTGCTMTGPITVTSTPTVTSLTISQAPGAAASVLPFTNPTGLLAGQIATGTNVPANDPIVRVSGGTSLVSLTAAIGEPLGGIFIAVNNSTGLFADMQVLDSTTAALTGATYAPAVVGNASAGVTVTGTAGAAGQNTITVSSGGTGCLTGMLVYDTTAAVIPTDTQIVSSTATSLTLNKQISGAGVGASDTIECFPGVRLSQITAAAVVSGDTLSFSPAAFLQAPTTGAVSSGATITFGGLSSSVTTSVSSLGTANAGAGGFQQQGQTILASGGGPWVPIPQCAAGACNLRVGIGAGANLPPGDVFTTAVGSNALNAFPGVNEENTAIGWHAGGVLGAGSAGFNTLLGVNVLGTDTTGNANVAIGVDAMRTGTGYSNNVAIGNQSLGDGTNESNNIAIGSSAMTASTGTPTATNNVAIGFSAMGAGNITTAGGNVAIGTYAATTATTLNNSVIIGYQAGDSLTNSGANVFVGANAGKSMVSNGFSTIVGDGAGQKVTGTGNTLIGYQAGYNTLVGGQQNLIIAAGENADAPSASSSFAINITNVITGTKGGGTNPTVCTLGELCVLGVLRSANNNVTTDQAITIAPMTSGNNGFMSTATKYIVTGVYQTNCSAADSTSAGGIYDAASKGGNALVAAAQTWASCASSSTMQTATLASIATTTVETTGTLYFSLTTPHGSALTGDVYVVGYPID